VGAAHFVSHFCQLTLAPLFPLVKAEFGVSYVALGFVITMFYAASGIGQAVCGFVVDRFGARHVLVAGMTTLAGAVVLAGLSPSYWALVAVATVAGAGNSVFHPADFAILNASIGPTRLGRAFSVHAVCGTLGFAAAPAVIVALSGVVGWRAALVAGGAAALGMVLLVASRMGELRDHRTAAAAPAGFTRDLRLLLTAPILAVFAFFMLVATAQIALQTFSVASMVAVYDVALPLASGALTGLLLGSGGGTLAGGFLADRTRRHDLVAAAGLTVSAALILLLATGAVPLGFLVVVMALAGFFMGVTTPSRDMLVRAATPTRSSGKVYGFVYSGLDIGALFTPVVFGWLLDHGEPRMVFGAAGVLMLLTVATVVPVRRGSVRAATAV
jgi:MFS family permease